MSIYRLFHGIFGKYLIEADRDRFEELLSSLGKKGINFWNAFSKDGKCFFEASVLSCESIVREAEYLKINIKIVKKTGLPFLFWKYRKRAGMFAGFLIFLISLFVSQLFVWRITVSGNKEVSKSEIIRELSKAGVKTGAYIPDIDPLKDANVLIMNFKKLSSAAINIKGTHINVEVLERTDMPKTEDISGYYNVVAARDGTILDYTAVDGTPEIGVGDTVFEGQLLINSFMEGRNGTFRPTHARGQVYAKTRHKFKIEINLWQTRKRYTGNVSEKSFLDILGRQTDVLKKEYSPYEYFDATVSENEKKLFGFIMLPVSETKITFMEYVPEKVKIKQSEAEKIAREKLDDAIKETGGEVLEVKSEIIFDEKNGTCVLFADAEIKLDIAREVPFFINIS